MFQPLRRAAALLFAATLSLLAVGLAAFLAGALVPREGATFSSPEAAPTRRVLLLSSFLHTDFALPADPEVVGRFAFLADGGLPVSDPAVEWIVAGWGGRAFYLETPQLSDIRPGPLFKALTVDAAVMHVELAGPIPHDHPTVRVLDLDAAAFERLIEYIEASFIEDETGGKAIVPGESYHDFDRFYEARGWFNALLGCNVWTAAGLRRAGIDTGIWNPLPVSLFWSLKRHNDEREFRPQGDQARERSP